MQTVSMMARYVPLNRIGAFTGVPASTAWRYDKDVLEAELPPPDFDNIRAILIDEKSVRRGHAYVTLVLNADTGELLHMEEGRKKASLESFFEKLTTIQKSSIEAVCIDRNGTYAAVINKCLPDAAIVYDKFHLIANLNEKVNDVRKAEYNKADAQMKGVMKGQRFNLMRNPENLLDKHVKPLNELLAMNESINIAYLLKDQFRFVWEYKYTAWARKYLEQWLDWAYESELQPVIQFARGVQRDMERIVSWCKYPITNGRIEGFNSIVSRIIFKCRGIRSLDYLWLKLRQESLLQM